MFVDIGNAPIYVNKQGTGEDALLLHGVPDSAELWNPLISRIQDSFTCYAPDLPGMYRSGIPDNFKFELEHYADYIDELVSQLNLTTPLTLILHDWGGIIGMLWASKYPHKVKRIIGGDFPFSHLYKWHPWARIWQTPVLGELSMLAMNWQMFKWELKRSSRRLSEADMRATYYGRATKMSVRKTVLKLYRSANPALLNHWSSKQKQLAKRVPIHLIWGQDDPHVPTHHANLMHPRSIEIIPNCGHWAPQEAPEVYERVIREVTGDDSIKKNALHTPNRVSSTKPTLEKVCSKQSIRHRYQTEKYGIPQYPNIKLYI